MYGTPQNLVLTVKALELLRFGSICTAAWASKSETGAVYTQEKYGGMGPWTLGVRDSLGFYRFHRPGTLSVTSLTVAGTRFRAQGL